MAGLEECSNGYCKIPGETFQMGSADGAPGDPDERPARRITMPGFELGQTEVSVGRYAEFLKKTNPGTQLQAVVSGCGDPNWTRVVIARGGESREQLKSRAIQIGAEKGCGAEPIFQEAPKGMPAFPQNLKGDNYPVVGLTFDEKIAFCKAKGGYLPTAAQLHFASRYDEVDIPRDQMVIRENDFRSTEPVDANALRKNRFGVYNLLGNVWESSLDAYDPKFYSRANAENPRNPLTDQNSQFQEVSGGSYYSLPEDVRSTNRGVGIPRYRRFDVGFRCAR